MNETEQGKTVMANNEFEYVRPEEIEKRSFEIITKELEEQGIVLTGDKSPDPYIC